MAQERSIEVKVGVLILVSLAILGAFILVMGGITFEKTYSVFVDFDNPGGLQSGAAVRMAGLKVGSVGELVFEGGKVDPVTGLRTLVRVKANIEAKYKDAIREDADFYVTTQGVLGEQFLAIDPGSPEKGVLKEGSVVKGIDPPRLDLFLAKAYELLDVTVKGIKNNKELISDIVTNTAGLLKGLNIIVTGNRERIDRMIANFEELSEEAKVLTHDARMNYVDNPKLIRTVDNIDKLSTDLKNDAGPLLADAKEAMANVKRLSATVGDPAQQEKLKKTLDDVAQLASRANAAASDAQAIVTQIKSGKGTVGALLMDEEIYDDMQEMVRDLKHNPWKFLWRE
jgi:phospholipid/cholesterol/gamma-HCH transport system substrate-binding protein